MAEPVPVSEPRQAPAAPPPASSGSGDPAAEHRGDEPPNATSPGATTALASVADRVGAILEAAEATAAAIRREAEADAARAAAERRRRQEARAEVHHLGRLADSLSVQAEALSRQCQLIVRVLLADEEPGEPPQATSAHGGRRSDAPAGPEPSATASASEPAESADFRQGEGRAADPPASHGESPATPPPAANEHDAAAGTGDEPGGASLAGASHSAADLGNGPVQGRLPAEWMEAYRMRLAGADHGEIESYLRERNVEDPERILAEVFREAPGER